MGEFDEFDIIERHAKEAAERRLTEAKERNAADKALEERQAMERKARARAFSLAANERLRLAEYAHYGVEPPPAAPITIGLLFQLGWTIEDVLGERRLIPPDPEKPRRKAREDYYRDGGT
jgi:hypothetical protein